MIHYFRRGCFVSKHVMQIIQKTVVGDQKKTFFANCCVFLYFGQRKIICHPPLFIYRGVTFILFAGLPSKVLYTFFDSK